MLARRLGAEVFLCSIGKGLFALLPEFEAELSPDEFKGSSEKSRAS
jgi:hypothetical protein